MYSVFEEHSTDGLTEDATDSAESVERRREEEEALRAISGTTPSAVEESVDALGTIRVTLEPGIWNAEATAMPPADRSRALRKRGYPEKRPVEVDLRDTKNIPGAALRELRAVLSKEAQQAVGEVAIHGLCAAAVDALEDLERGALPLSGRAKRREADAAQKATESGRARARPGQGAPRRAEAERGRAPPRLRAEQEPQARRPVRDAPVRGAARYRGLRVVQRRLVELVVGRRARRAAASRAATLRFQRGAFSGGAAAGSARS